MDLRQLECLFAVADKLHFGRAAASLFRSQAAVSESIRALEYELGGELFARTTRSVQLTPFGSKCVVALRPSYESLIGEFRGLQQTRPRSEVTIAYTPELGEFILPHWVRNLLDNDVPELADAWSPHVMHTQQQVDAVLSGAVDIGICWQPRPQANLAISVLARCPHVLVMPATDLLTQRPSVRLADLRDRRVLVSPARHHPLIDAMVRAGTARAGVNASSFEETASYDQIALAVVAGAGIGIHPSTIVAINRVPGIVFRPIADDDLPIDICAIRRAAHPDQRGDRLLGLLSDAVAAAMRTLPIAPEASGQPAASGPVESATAPSGSAG